SRTLSIDAGYPNPLRAGDHATVRFSIPDRNASVTLRMYDMLGRVVRDLPAGQYTPGTHTINLTSDGLPSGVYTMTLTDGVHSTSRMMVIVD
ncbi:MAG: T9SS type A sorting domain-containing protein, partial [Bacteroidetes bacterium]|nr:T9SS type A sorting domain-containing protein [Bacteroidota bacterium]